MAKRYTRGGVDKPQTVGPYWEEMIAIDIKHMDFSLSRYKFASKLLMYREKIDLLELGCQEALGAIMFK